MTEQEAKVAEASAQLAAAAQQDSSARGNDASRRGEAAQLRASVADYEQRLKASDEQIRALEDPKTQEAMDQVPDLQQQEQQARNDIAQLTNQLDTNRRMATRSGSIDVIMLDGK
jgi:septation ring formation regulator EzrA